MSRYSNLRHILISLAVTALLATDATATNCWILSSDDPLSEAIQLSDIVFVGEAESVRKVSIQHKGNVEFVEEIQAVFLVEESLKGPTKDIARVTATAGAPCQCRYEFEPGVKYLVLASLDENSYVTKFCRFIRVAAEEVENEARSKIRSDE
jgi:hypothetical protein